METMPLLQVVHTQEGMVREGGGGGGSLFLFYKFLVLYNNNNNFLKHIFTRNSDTLGILQQC